MPHLRSQDLKNKQASHDDLDPEFKALMEGKINTLYAQAFDLYEYMLEKGGKVRPFDPAPGDAHPPLHERQHPQLDSLRPDPRRR